MLIPRGIDCRGVTFKYRLGAQFIDVLRTLHLIGWTGPPGSDHPSV